MNRIRLSALLAEPKSSKTEGRVVKMARLDSPKWKFHQLAYHYLRVSEWCASVAAQRRLWAPCQHSRQSSTQ